MKLLKNITNIKRTGVVITILFCMMSGPGFATSNLHLELENRVDQVFVGNSNALKLAQVQQMALENNPDPRIAYERLVKAEQEMKAALARLLPLNTGMAIRMAVGATWNIFSTVYLAGQILSLPSRWFYRKKTKYISRSEKYLYHATLEDLRNQVASIYFGLVSQNISLELTKLEAELLETLIVNAKMKVDLDQMSNAEYQGLKRRQFTLNDEILTIEVLLKRQTATFNEIIGNPNPELKFNLSPMNDTVDPQLLNSDRLYLIRMAKARSLKLKSAALLVKATKYGKKAAVWSPLSLQGIGFGLFANIRSAKSEHRSSKFRKTILETSIGQKVYTAHLALETSVDAYGLQKEATTLSKGEVAFATTLYSKGKVQLSYLLEAELEYLKEVKREVVSHYRTHMNNANVERMVLLDPIVEQNDYDAIFELEHKRTRAFFSFSNDSITFKVRGDMEEVSGIRSVRYTFHGSSIRDKVVYSHDDKRFGHTIKAKKDKVVSGVAIITLKNRQVVKKNFVIEALTPEETNSYFLEDY